MLTRSAWKQVGLADGLSMKELARLAVADNPNGLAWSPDGKTIAVSGPFALFDADGKQLPQPQGPARSRAVVFGSGKAAGRLLVIHYTPTHQATLIDLKSGKAITRFAPEDRQRGSPPSEKAMGGALSPDGKLAATVGHYREGEEAYLWKTAGGAVVHRLRERKWLVGKSAAWSEDGSRVAWGWGPGKQDRAFDFTKLELARVAPGTRWIRPSLKEGAMTLDWRDRETHFRSRAIVKDGKIVRRLAVPARSVKPLTATFVGPDRVAMSGEWGGLFLYDTATGKRIREFKLNEDRRGGTPFQRFIAPSPARPRYLATPGNGSRLVIWNPESERPLLSLFVAGQDWVVWTEEGYYAATPGGERLVGWAVDNGIDKLPSVYPAERFRKKLYRPDVIRKTFELGSVEAALKALDGKQARVADVEQVLPPRASLRVVKEDQGQVTVEVTAEAQAKTQPVVALRLMLDGRPFPDLDPKVFAPGRPAASFPWTVAVPPGEHRLAVLASSEDASALSEAVTLRHLAASQQPVLHLLSVGIDQYTNGIPKLSSAAKDARDLAEAFPLAKHGALFREVRAAKPLTDRKATLAAVRGRLAALRGEVKTGDVVVLFFAGHSVSDKGDFFLLTADSHPDRLARTALPGRELSRLLCDLRGVQVLLLLDACHSPAVAKRRPGTDNAARALASDEVGAVVLAAAMGHQEAYKHGGNGLFTLAVKEALAGGARVPRNHQDHRLYVHHLYIYVLDSVSERSGQRQHPFLSLPSGVAPFALRQFPRP